jgi:hypothetical protein
MKIDTMKKATLLNIVAKCHLPIANADRYRLIDLRSEVARLIPTYIEDHFLRLVRRDILPRGYRLPSRNKRFLPPTLLEFDWCWVSKKVSVEIHGGLKHPRSGHRTEAGVKRDMKKCNLAQQAGWFHIQLTSEEVMEDDQWQTFTLPLILQALRRFESNASTT